MQNRAEERNRASRLDVTAGIQLQIEDVAHIAPCISVAAVHHHFIVLADILECVNGEVLAVLAVVRIVLVKVGVQRIAKRADRDGGDIVLAVFLQQFLIEFAVAGRRNRERIEADVFLLRRAVLSLGRIAVINGLDRVLFEVQRVEERVLGAVREVEIGIQTDLTAVICLVDLLCLFQQILEARFAADLSDPRERGRNLGIHTAVCKARKLEVDVGNARFGKPFVHIQHVVKGGERRHQVDRDGCNGLLRFHRAEHFHVQRDVLCNILLGQFGQHAFIDQIIPISVRHAEPRSVVVRSRLTCREFLVAEQLILNRDISRVLPVGNNRPCLTARNRNGIRNVVAVLRLRVEVVAHRCIVRNIPREIGLQLAERFARFDDGNISAFVGGFLNFSDQLRFFLFQFRQDLLLGHNGIGNAFGCGFAPHDRLLGCGIFLAGIHQFGIGVGVDHLGCNRSVNRRTDRLLVSGSGDLMVGVVLTVDLAANRVRLAQIEVKERTGAIREEVVTLVFGIARAHVRQNRKILQHIGRHVVLQAVDRHTNRQPAVVQRVLQRQFEGRIFLFLCHIAGFLVVRVHLFERVVRTVLADVILHHLLLDVRRVRGEHADRQILSGRVGAGVLLDAIFLLRLRFHFGGILFLIVGVDLVDVEETVILRLTQLASLNRIKQRLVNQVLVVLFGKLSRNQLPERFLSDGVLHANAVFDLGDLDLIQHCGILKTVQRFGRIVLGLFVLHDHLRHQQGLLGSRFARGRTVRLEHCRALGACHVIRVGEQHIHMIRSERCGLNQCNLAARHRSGAGLFPVLVHVRNVLIHIQLIAVVLKHFGHACELFLGRFVNVRLHIDSGNLHITQLTCGADRQSSDKRDRSEHQHDS